jgi:hypothetical protein
MREIDVIAIYMVEGPCAGMGIGHGIAKALLEVNPISVPLEENRGYQRDPGQRRGRNTVKGQQGKLPVLQR